MPKPPKSKPKPKEEPVVRLTAYVPESLARAVRVRAAQHDQTVSELVVAALQHSV
jgi:plasmid stability protein